MIRRIFWLFIGLVCLICSSLALVPILGNSVEANVTENSSRTVYVKRGSRYVYVNKNGYEQKKTRTEYTYSYEFTINGEKYTGSSSEYEQIHKKGGKVTVYYLPFYPKIHSSMNPNHLYILCGICLLCGIVIIRSSFTGRRPAIEIGNNVFAAGPKYPTANEIASINKQIATQSQTQYQPQQIQSPNNSNQSAYSFCPKCGSALASGYAFCPKCGFKI